MRAACARLLVCAFALVVGTAVASADDWKPDVHGEVTAAVADFQYDGLAVQCDAGNLELYYFTRKESLADEYKSATDAYLLVKFDEKDGGLHTSLPVKLSERDENVAFGITGRYAAETARAIAQTTALLFVGVAPTKPTDEMFGQLSVMVAPSGAHDAINAALVACGFEPAASLTAAAAPADAAEDVGWDYDAHNNKAVAIQKGHLLAVLCGEKNTITVYYSVPLERLEKALVDRKSPYLVISIDEGLDGLSGYSVKTRPQDIDDTRYFVFQGRSAIDLARKMGEAEDHVFVAVTTKDPATAGKNYPKYNSNVYPAIGADVAIPVLFQRCPQG